MRIATESDLTVDENSAMADRYRAGEDTPCAFYKINNTSAPNKFVGKQQVSKAVNTPAAVNVRSKDAGGTTMTTKGSFKSSFEQSRVSLPINALPPLMRESSEVKPQEVTNWPKGAAVAMRNSATSKLRDVPKSK